jgi:hypothetical protein
MKIFLQKVHVENLLQKLDKILLSALPVFLGFFVFLRFRVFLSATTNDTIFCKQGDKNIQN